MQEKKRSVMMALARTRRAWMDHTKAVALEIGIPESYRIIILFLSRHPGANQKQIAEYANITTAAINQTIKEMVCDGYVKKETDENDKRHTRVFLTEKGQEIGGNLLERLSHSDEVITEVISEAKEAEMIELLDKIHDCIRRDLTTC